MNSTLEALVRRGCRAWNPPTYLPLSDWSEEYGYLSGEASAVIGRFHCFPYQREMFDAFTDPRVEFLTLMKSARVGGTKLINFAIAYQIHQNPRSMLIVHPTLSSAKRYSKIELKPMFRDMPCLKGLVAEEKSRSSSTSCLERGFNGGTIFIVGSNSPADLSGLSTGVVIGDEVERHSSEAGKEGDPFDLAIIRSETFPDRKIVRVSSPGDKGTSKIEPAFLEGDQRYRHMPCPHCGNLAPLFFRENSEFGPAHIMEWPKHYPEKAFFRCAGCGKEIHESEKRGMDKNGVWVPRREFTNHASFFIWAAYSYSANATWGKLACDFVRVKDSPTKLKVFVNTRLGQTWAAQGDAPDWHRLYERREDFPRGVVPERARVLTGAADVQQDRIEVGLVAWAPGLEWWSIDYRVFHGPTDSLSSPVWHALDSLLVEAFPSETGRPFTIARFGIDCGYNTQVVTSWVKRQAFPRVMAIRGSDHERQIVGLPSYTEASLNGKRLKGSVKHYPIGVSLVKSELYGWLRHCSPTEENPTIPIGYGHFSRSIHNEEHFRQLTAEHLECVVTRTGRHKYEWVKDYKRNEFLDIMVYNRALAFLLGVDRWKPAEGGVTLPKQLTVKADTVRPEPPKQADQPLRQSRRRPRPLTNRARRLW